MPTKIILTTLLVSSMFFGASLPATAADEVPCTFTSAAGLLKDGKIFSSGCKPTDLIAYINALNTFFYRLAIVLAVLMITVGGLQWLLAIGNSSKISNAKDTIQQAILGLIFALTAILLFNQIDSSFTELNADRLSLVPNIDKTPCEQRTLENNKAGAVNCVAVDGVHNCIWVPKDEKNYFGAGTCKNDNCPTILKQFNNKKTADPFECKVLSVEEKLCINSQPENVFGWRAACCIDPTSASTVPVATAIWNLPADKASAPCLACDGKWDDQMSNCGWIIGSR